MKKCKYCGSENKNSATYCYSCGAKEFSYKCGNCGTVFEEGLYCPRCGVKAGTRPKRCPYCGIEYFSAACPECGYRSRNDIRNTTFIYTNGRDYPQPRKKRKTWLWVLGWIIMFPIPLTILIVRNPKLNTTVKAVIIALGWLIYLLIALSGGDSSNSVTNTIADLNGTNSYNTQEYNFSDNNEVHYEPSSSEIVEPVNTTKESAVDSLINGYNLSASNKLQFVEDFSVQDKESDHYRVEFRLDAYKDSIGKSYKIGDQVVDIICTQRSFSDDVDIRIYSDGASLDQCIELIKYASPLLDKTIEESEVNETIDYVLEHKEANGYYYGNLGMVLSGSDNKGYSLMIGTD